MCNAENVLCCDPRGEGGGGERKRSVRIGGGQGGCHPISSNKKCKCPISSKKKFIFIFLFLDSESTSEWLMYNLRSELKSQGGYQR